MLLNLVVALAFVAAAALVGWHVLLPRTVCDHMRRHRAGAGCNTCSRGHCATDGTNAPPAAP